MISYPPFFGRPNPMVQSFPPPPPPPPPPAPPPATSALRFGANLPAVVYYEPLSEMYRNLLEGANGFDSLVSGSAPINASDGFPTTDFKTVPQSFMGTSTSRGRIKGDVSSITFAGGAVTLDAYDAGTNTRTFTIAHTVSGEWGYMTFNGTKRTAGGTPGEGIQELILLRPGDTNFATVSDRSQLFTTQYITHLRNFAGPLRAMDFFSTNNNVATRAAIDRATIVNSRTNTCYLNSTTSPQTEGLMGRPDEDLVALCEQAVMDAWVCIPIGATDPYVAAQAARFLAGLTQSQKIYVELGNELWNNSFNASTYTRHAVCDEMSGYYDYDATGSDPYKIVAFVGNAGTSVTIEVPASRPHGYVLGDNIWTYPGQYQVTNVASTTIFTINLPGFTGSSPRNSSFSMMKQTATSMRRGSNFGDDPVYSVYELAYRWIERRVTQVSDIWRTVFGDLAMGPRVRIIFADQIGYYPADAQGYFDDMAALFPARAVNQYVWGLAGAPYCGYATISPTDSNPAITEADYIANMGLYITSGMASGWWERRLCTCAIYGLVSICYEGGPDSFGDAGATNNLKKNAGNFDATMQAFYAEYLNRWYRLGGQDFVWYHGGFQAAVSNSPYGCWAVATYTGDTTTAKMAAIIARLAAGLPAITRNVATVGTQTDGRLMADHFQAPDVPSGNFPNLSDADTDYPHDGRGEWLVYSAIAQGLNLSFVYTCDDGTSGATLSVNGTTIGGTITFSGTPADQTTLKETSPQMASLRSGWNAIFLTRVGAGAARINALKWT